MNYSILKYSTSFNAQNSNSAKLKLKIPERKTLITRAKTQNTRTKLELFTCSNSTVWNSNLMKSELDLARVNTDLGRIIYDFHFLNFANLQHYQMWNFLKNQNSGPPKWPKLQFFTSKNCKIWFYVSEILAVFNAIKCGIFSKNQNSEPQNLPKLPKFNKKFECTLMVQVFWSRKS